jgi:hypothetical protein
VSDSLDTDPPDRTPADVSPEAPEQDVLSQDVPSPAENYQQVDPELRAGFWKLVALLKIAIIVLTIGGLVALFRADYELAARLLIPGTMVFGYACYRAYRLKTRIDAGEFEHDLDAGSDNRGGSGGDSGEGNASPEPDSPEGVEP